MILAIIFGAHLLPYSWLYKSRVYLILSIFIPFCFSRWTKLEASHFGFDNDGNRNGLFFSFNMGKQKISGLKESETICGAGILIICSFL